MAVASGDSALGYLAFYLQSLAVADFLIERSGNSGLLGEISQALADGSTFEAWLAADGSRHRLGFDMAELERHWSAWANLQREAATP